MRGPLQTLNPLAPAPGADGHMYTPEELAAMVYDHLALKDYLTGPFMTAP